MEESDDFYTAVQYLALNVVADERWLEENDTFAVTVFGFLLYGFALKYSRILAFDPAEAAPVVRRAMTEILQCASKWTDGFLVEAYKSALDPQHHQGQYDLVAIGGTYDLREDMSDAINNVFANISAHRKARSKNG